MDLQSIVDENAPEQDKKFFISKIYDVSSDDEVEILMPMEKTRLQLLPVGSEYDIYFYAKKGIYTCRVQVSERYKTENAVVAVLQLTSLLEKHQRREYYRYSTVIGMNTRILSPEEETLYLEGQQLIYSAEPDDKSVIVDISGGGLRFVCANHYELNRLLHCKFVLHVRDEKQVIDCVIRILGSKPVANNPSNTEYRGQFLFLNNYEREMIIHFIFEEERKMRQRR